MHQTAYWNWQVKARLQPDISSQDLDSRFESFAAVQAASSALHRHMECLSGSEISRLRSLRKLLASREAILASEVRPRNDLCGTRHRGREVDPSLARMFKLLWVRSICLGPVKKRLQWVLQNKYDQSTVRVHRSKNSRAKSISQQKVERKAREHRHSNRLRRKKVDGNSMKGTKASFGSDVISPFFSPPNEVSHWQAACESGRVLLRLLPRWRIYETRRGFVCGSPAGEQTRERLVVQMWRV